MRPSLSPLCEFAEDESVPSWVSRLAVLNGVDTAREFCLDMGFPFRACVSGYPAALARLSELTGIPREALQRASFVIRGPDLVLRGERLAHGMVRRSRIHVCPVCAREDIEVDRPPHLPAPYGRTLWQLSAMRSCHRHGCALVEIARNSGLAMYDFALNLRGRNSDIVRLADELEPRRASALETYLENRLELRKTGSAWLDRLQLHVVVPLCEMLGALILFGPKARLKAMSDSDLHRAGDAGFHIARHGEPSIRQTLSELQQTHVRNVHGREGPAAIFGAFYLLLSLHHQDEAFEPVCDLVRRHVIETMPFGPGDVVLGKPVETRIIHSAITASRDIGRTPVRLRKLLAAAGLIPSDHTRFSSHAVVFDAEAAQAFLKADADSLMLPDVATYLNISRFQVGQFADRGFIQPLAEYRAKRDLRRRTYARKPLDEFLARLVNGAEPVETPSETRIPVTIAARRARCDLTVLIELILKGQLNWVGRHVEQAGIPSTLIDFSEIKHKVHLDPEGLTVPKSREILKTSMVVVRNLIKHGYLDYKFVILASTKNRVRMIERSSLKKFQAAYVSIPELAATHGKSYRSICAALTNIRPAIEKQRVSLAYYRRVDLPPF